MLKTPALFLLAIGCSLHHATARAEADDAGKPLWEIGLGGGGAYVPDYPAAGESQFAGIVLPFVIYRGEFLRSDEDGLRGKIAETDRLKLNLGVDASFSAESDDNPERRGLPDLDYLLEIGPSLEYRLAGEEQGTRRLIAIGQARAAFAVNTDRFDYTGYALEPQLELEDDNFLHPGLELTVGLGVKFGYDGLNQYFYDVEPRFATASRPAYRSDDGYQGSSISVRLFYPLTSRLRLFAATQLFFHAGSSNEDSPLYREDFNIGFGGGMAYSFWVSEILVED